MARVKRPLAGQLGSQLRWYALVAATSLGFVGCDRGSRNLARLSGGDPHRGAAAIRTYGCGTCHVVPGVRGATGTVGPPLAGIAQRAYIGGVLTNTPENLVRWLQDPPSVDPKTAMPNVGVTYQDAVDIAGYLYSRK
jgi:cytochrome c2